MSEDTEQIARAAFAQILAQYPHLRWIENKDDPVEISISLPAQEGLAQRVWLCLQNNDELHFSVGHFWCEWFPCTEAEKSRRYVDAVCGFISGRYRVLEHYKGATCIKAQLQEPHEDDWRTIATWSDLRLPSWTGTRLQVIANV